MKLNFVCAVIFMLLIGIRCSPLKPHETDQQVFTTQNSVQSINDRPNVFLTIVYDEWEVLPKPDELTILIDNRLIESVAVDNKFVLYLDPGSYDIQISSVVNRSAARGIITVVENSTVEQSFILKTEAWSLLGDEYNIRLIGLNENKVLDKNAGLTFGVFNATGNLLPIDHISMVRVEQIEEGSFVENVGGFPMRRAILIQDMFSTNGVTATIGDAANFTRLSNTFEPGEYVIEISIWDSVNDKSYHDVTNFRVLSKTQ